MKHSHYHDNLRRAGLQLKRGRAESTHPTTRAVFCAGPEDNSQLEAAVSMTITDDGKGFRTEPVFSKKKIGRLGLLGMKERLEMVGGNLIIESTPGQGTTIRALIPCGSVPGGGLVNGPANA